MRPTTFKVDNTIYWTIRTYTGAGVLVDADSTPSVSVRKNGASVGDVVTVTKRAATTGIYDCSYNPAGEVEGDSFTIEETATVSSQAYENAWSIEAQALERGTDASSVADAVWDESLSSHNTGGSAGKALKNLKEGIVSYEGQVNDASATTTSFITNLASSIDDFYNSQTIHFISGTLQGQSRLVLDYDGSTKTITVEEQLSNAPANGTEFIILSTHVHTMAEIADGVWDEAQSGHTTVGTFGYFLDAQVSGAGAGGSGLYQVTVRVEDSGNNALQGARVNVDGTLLTLATGSSGEVTFNLDSGVYLLNVSPPAGYTTPIGQVVTVTTSDISETFTLVGSGTCSPGWVG